MKPRVWVAFATVAVLWGLPYFFIKVAVGEVSPSVVAWARLVLAAALLLPVAASRGAIGPVLRRWRWGLALAVTYYAVPFTLIPIGETYIPSSLTAIIIAFVPITITLISLPVTRPSRVAVAGLGTGFVGVALLVGVDVGGRPRELIGVACILAVTLLYAVGPLIIARRLGGLDAIGTTAATTGAGALMLTPLALAQWPARVPSGGVLAALVALGVLCTAVALTAYLFVIQQAGPSRASVVTYINPAIAVLVGVVVLSEPLTVSALAGMALILAGSYLATTGRTAARPARPGGAPGGCWGGGGGPSRRRL